MSDPNSPWYFFARVRAMRVKDNYGWTAFLQITDDAGKTWRRFTSEEITAWNKQYAPTPAEQNPSASDDQTPGL